MDRTTESPSLLSLGPGITAAVSADDERNWVFLSITDGAGRHPLTIRIPAQQASDLAVALVNAANGV